MPQCRQTKMTNRGLSVGRYGRCALPLAPGRRLLVQTSAEAKTQLNRAVNTKSCSGPIMVRSSLSAGETEDLQPRSGNP